MRSGCGSTSRIFGEEHEGLWEVLVTDQRVYILVDATLAKSLTTLTALTGIQHDQIAKEG